MSLLLDALNKADQERKRNETTPGISSNHEQRGGDDEESRGYSLPLIIAGVVGLCALLVVIYWLGQRSTATAPAPAAVATSAAPVESQRPNATPAPNPAPPQPSVANADPAPKTDENVADLYQQSTQVPASNAAITIAPPQPAQATVEQAPVSPENIASPTSITQFKNLPELHALPNNILDKVPTLTYSEHNYNGSNSSVKINGTIHHVNDQIANGIVIDQILEDGMVLHIDNYSFKMRAMNSWINM